MSFIRGWISCKRIVFLKHRKAHLQGEMTMLTRQAAILLCVCSPILLTSCTTAPILKLNNELLPAKVDGKPYTQEEVQKAILRACNRRGWSAQVQGEGVILASLLIRNYSAKVEIQYTSSTISISYVDSQGLGYHRDQIHRNYNRWVANLYHTILSELGSRGQKY
jgi:hypothetical protein